MWVFLNKVLYREGLLAPRPTSKLEDHPSSAVRDCLLNIFAATLLIGGRSSIRNLMTRHATVTGTHYMDSNLIGGENANICNLPRTSAITYCIHVLCTRIAVRFFGAFRIIILFSFILNTWVKFNFLIWLLHLLERFILWHWQGREPRPTCDLVILLVTCLFFILFLHLTLEWTASAVCDALVLVINMFCGFYRRYP